MFTPPELFQNHNLLRYVSASVADLVADILAHSLQNISQSEQTEAIREDRFSRSATNFPLDLGLGFDRAVLTQLKTFGSK